jgi:hypothetical protein
MLSWNYYIDYGAYRGLSLRILLVFIFAKSYLKVSWVCLNQLLHNMNLEARSIKFDKILLTVSCMLNIKMSVIC